MTELALRDIDPDLAGRIQRLAEAEHRNQDDVLREVIAVGVKACEVALRKRLDAREEETLQRAIAALEDVPDDPGFGLIGRVAEA